MDPLVVEGVAKSYRRQAYRSRFRSLKSVLLGRDRALGAGRGAWIQALEDVSFRVRAGTTLGIIGRNGSGKSTLLKILAGITRPTAGRVSTSGRVAALIELGAGFHPEISGRENVFINGIMLGLTRQEIARRFPEIVRFAELEEFIDLPVKTYSSGMYMRLGFSVAVHVDPEILLIDEILAVGDEAFSHKCLERIRNFQRRRKTIVLVSHSLDMVEGLCDEAIWLDRGRVLEQGDPRRVVGAYLLSVAGQEDAELAGRGGRVEEDRPAEAGGAAEVPAAAVGAGGEERPADAAAGGGAPAAAGEAGAAEALPAAGLERRRWGTREVEITAVHILDRGGEGRYVYGPGDPLTLRVELEVRLPGERDMVFGVGIFDAGGVCCYGTNTEIEGLRPAAVGMGRQWFSFRIGRLDLVEGSYFLDLAVHRRDGYAFDYHRGLYSFRVRSRLKDVGIARLGHRWEFSPGIEMGEAPERETDSSPGTAGAAAGVADAAFRQGGAETGDPPSVSRGAGEDPSPASAPAEGAPAAPPRPGKVAGAAEAARRLQAAREAGQKVVFTNGCFDLLHGGHVQLLQRAAVEGDFLVVGLNSDGSVRRLKGPTRPILRLEERALVLSALESVDLVVPFEEDTPLELIRLLRPDVLVKGADWSRERVVGALEVEAEGGRVVLVPLVAGKSTTALAERLRQGGKAEGA